MAQCSVHHHDKSGVDQKLDFKVPATGELYKEAVEVSGGTNVSPAVSESISIDFGRAVTVKANQIDQYKIQLKLFGLIPLKEVDVEVIQDLMLKPAGIPIGIYVKTQGVLVVGTGNSRATTARNIIRESMFFRPGIIFWKSMMRKSMKRKR